jgi:CO dehydrogenase maturation factor
MDIMFAVTDSSVRGLQAARRIKELVEELKLDVRRIALIVNRVAGGELEEVTKREIEKIGLELAGVVPNDVNVYEYDLEGKATFELPADSVAVKAVAEIVEKYLK